jgi:hypothetical protein
VSQSFIINFYTDGEANCAALQDQTVGKNGWELMDCYVVYWVFTNRKLRRGKFMDLFCSPNIIRKRK